jgi:hypothetical protein
MPLTGAGFNAVGRQLQAALKLYMEQHGDTVAGRQIQITIRDDGGVADNARRLIQERIVNQKVDILGIGITPTALAIAQLATESKKATLVLRALRSRRQNLLTTCAPVSSCRRSLGYWPNGRPRTAANAWSRWSTTGRQEWKRKPRSRRGSNKLAARSLKPCAFRLPIRISRRSATHRRHQARHRLYLFPGHAGADLRQAICRTRLGPIKYQNHRAGRSHRR